MCVRNLIILEIESEKREDSERKNLNGQALSDEEFLDLKCSAEEFMEKVVNVGDQRYELTASHTRQMIEGKPYEGTESNKKKKVIRFDFLTDDHFFCFSDFCFLFRVQNLVLNASIFIK